MRDSNGSQSPIRVSLHPRRWRSVYDAPAGAGATRCGIRVVHDATAFDPISGGIGWIERDPLGERLAGHTVVIAVETMGITEVLFEHRLGLLLGVEIRAVEVLL